jgi:hypothetical protein
MALSNTEHILRMLCILFTLPPVCATACCDVAYLDMLEGQISIGPYVSKILRFINQSSILKVLVSGGFNVISMCAFV